ncbi:hypothetical protein F5141DRAFT_1007289, partial [Pisolithus sp. B1]
CALLLPPEYNMSIQSWLPAAVCCIHNIICLHNPDNIDILDPDQINEDDGPLLMPENSDVGNLQDTPLNADSCRQMNTVCDMIMEQMWNDFCVEHTRRGLPHIIEQLD